MFSFHSRLISHLRPYTIPELWKFWFFSENLDVFPKSWILNSESQIWTVLLLRSFKIVFRTVSEKFQWLSWQKTCEVSISRGLNYPFWGLNCPDFTVLKNILIFRNFRVRRRSKVKFQISEIFLEKTDFLVSNSPIIMLVFALGLLFEEKS